MILLRIKPIYIFLLQKPPCPSKKHVIWQSVNAKYKTKGNQMKNIILRETRVDFIFSTTHTHKAIISEKETCTAIISLVKTYRTHYLLTLPQETPCLTKGLLQYLASSRKI